MREWTNVDECGRLIGERERSMGEKHSRGGGREGAIVHDRFGDCCARDGRLVQSPISRPKSIAATDMQSI